MRIERLNNQKKIEHHLFKLKIATINRKQPSVIYFKGGTFITPIIDKDNYKNDITIFDKKLKTLIKNELENVYRNHLSDLFIHKLDIKKNSIKHGQTSFLTIECHFRQKDDENLLCLTDMKNLMENSICNLIDRFVEIIIEHGYIISKNK